MRMRTIIRFGMFGWLVVCGAAVFAGVRDGAALAETNTKCGIHIECESFESLGGWVNDTQFMDQMGSPYLLAHGLGKRVANAKTSFKISCDGRYFVTARTKNWTALWSATPAGRFRILVDGVVLPNVLGVSGKGEWLVETAGEIELKKGVHTIELQDLTGFDGRCDWVELKNDPSAVAAVPSRPSRTFTCDLVVVGGGIAGMTAAISAARLGMSVALVQDRPVLGGNNSSEVRVHLGAWQNMPPYPRLGDVLAEFGPKEGGIAQPKAVYEDDLKLKAIQAEKNIALYLNTHVNAVAAKDGVIASVTGVDTRTGVKTTFVGRWFVDATGDGTVGVLAGADWRMGRESKGETGEAWAPEKADMLTMGASVQWYAGKAADGADAAFPMEPWMLRSINEKNAHCKLRGDWNWETGFGRDQVAEGERIRDYGLIVAFSNWAFVKNLSSRKAEFVDAELKWVAFLAGRRESRRLMGDYILSENDFDARRTFEDGTCATTWTIDLHLPKAATNSNFTGEAFRGDSLNKVIWPLAIPYRCLYSRNIGNLFMAGRDISVTHIALGTTRLMRTHGMMGEVVGMAASLCKKHGCSPRDVYAKHLGELKELMTRGVGDGKPHPSQMYHIQRSLDPRFDASKNTNEQIRDNP